MISIEPTYFPDGYNIRTTQKKEVIIIDFIQSNKDEKAVISSIAIPKSVALDLIEKIKLLLKEEND